MASLLEGLFGQQDQPQQYIPTAQDILNQVYNSVPGIAKATANYNRLLAPSIVEYNKVLAPGIAEAQRAGENVYDPNRGAIREAAGAQILKNLQNPYAVPPEVSAMLRQQGFEQGALTGTGGSNAANASTARNLGLFSTDLANSRISQGAAYGSNTANLFQPQNLQSIGMTPADAGSAYATQVANQNSANRYNAELEAQNARNLFSTPLNLAATTAGTFLGSMMGTNAGGLSSIFGNGGNAMAGVPYSPFGDFGGSWNATGNAVVPQAASSSMFKYTPRVR